MCGKQFTFLYPSPYEHVQYNVSEVADPGSEKRGGGARFFF